jgi:hypothetical protein
MTDGKDIERLLAKAASSHLSEKELGAYHDGILTGPARARVEAHLTRCLVCSRKLEMMKEVLEGAREPVTEEEITHVEALLDRMRVRKPLAGVARDQAGTVEGAFVSLLEKYRSLVEAGRQRFQAAIETARDWLLVAGIPLATERGIERGAGLERNAGFRSESSPDFTHVIGDEPFAREATPPVTPGYHTLIMARFDRNDMVVLYENEPISRPLQVRPEFRDDDVGLNRLYLIYTARPLDIDTHEIEIDAGRFAEIIAQAEKEKAHAATFTVLVAKRQ